MCVFGRGVLKQIVFVIVTHGLGPPIAYSFEVQGLVLDLGFRV